MKYGESTFDIIYLLFAIISGIVILANRRDSIGKLMGSAALILGCGDAFHLVPRVLNYFIESDFTAWLGFGKLVTSITMTFFYMLIFFLHTKLFTWEEGKKKSMAICLWLLTACRIFICFLPGNHWLTGEGSVLWGCLRNIPFIAIGLLIVIIYFKTRRENPLFKRVWLYVSLSFLFYIPVAVFASLLPLLGMLMLPKTVCYMLMLRIFLKQSNHNNIRKSLKGENTMGVFSKIHRYRNVGENANVNNVERFGAPAISLFTSTKVFTLHHHIDIMDSSETILYEADTKILTLHDTTDIYTADGEHVANIRRKLLSLHERRFVVMDDGKEFQLSNEIFHIIKDITNIEGLGWQLRGNLLGLNFEIYDSSDEVIAVIAQKMFSIHDKWCVDIYKKEHEKIIVAILVALQHMIRDRQSHGGGGSSSGGSSSGN